MEIFILSSRGYQKTIGMDQDTVIRLLQELGATEIRLITEADYNQGVNVL